MVNHAKADQTLKMAGYTQKSYLTLEILVYIARGIASL